MRVYRNLTTAAALVLFAWAAGCSNTATNAAGMSDEDLEKAVMAQINSNPQLAAYDIDVDADAEQHQVTLSGTVPAEVLRTEAVNMAQEVGSDIRVIDKIDVDASKIARSEYTSQMATEERQMAAKAREKIGDSLEDAWIHTKVRTKLAGEGELPFGGINVDVIDNVVTLRGTVESQDAKMDAERIAKNTDGVSGVKDELVIKPGE